MAVYVYGGHLCTRSGVHNLSKRMMGSTRSQYVQCVLLMPRESTWATFIFSKNNSNFLYAEGYKDHVSPNTHPKRMYNPYGIIHFVRPIHVLRHV